MLTCLSSQVSWMYFLLELCLNEPNHLEGENESLADILKSYMQKSSGYLV